MEVMTNSSEVFLANYKTSSYPCLVFIVYFISAGEGSESKQTFKLKKNIRNSTKSLNPGYKEL